MRHADVDEMTSLDDKMEFIISGTGCLEVEPVYDTKHPADGANLDELRKAIPHHII